MYRGIMIMVMVIFISVTKSLKKYICANKRTISLHLFQFTQSSDCRLAYITLKNLDFDSILSCNEIYYPNMISVGIVMSFLYQNLAQRLVF